MPLSNETKKRLLETAAMLFEIPDRKFDLSVFGSSRSDQTKIAIQEGYCNTVGCALGWEATTERAQKRGLSTISWACDGKRIYDIRFTEEKTNSYMEEGIMAGACYYRIPYEHANYLFNTPACWRRSPYRYMKPKPGTVAKAILNYVLKNGEI